MLVIQVTVLGLLFHVFTFNMTNASGSFQGSTGLTDATKLGIVSWELSGQRCA